MSVFDNLSNLIQERNIHYAFIFNDHIYVEVDKGDDDYLVYDSKDFSLSDCVGAFSKQVYDIPDSEIKEMSIEELKEW